MFTVRFAAISYVALGLAVSATAQSTVYVFDDLGLPNNAVATGRYLGGADINNNGVIVGAFRWQSGNPDNFTHGFKWEQGVVTEVFIPAAILSQEPFFTLCKPDVPETQTASCRVSDVIPRAIDDIGRIAGTLTIRKTQCQGGNCSDDVGWTRGFVMPDGGNATIIGCPASCIGGLADVWGINITGVVTGDFTVPDSFLHHGFRDGTVLDYPGAAGTHARGINARFDMDVVGFYFPQSPLNFTEVRGYLFSLGSWIPIDFPAAQSTEPSAINDAGDIVGTYSDVTFQPHGFVWPNAPSGTPSTITDGTSEMVQALGNNDNGQIVGIAVLPNVGPRFVVAHDSAVELPGAFSKIGPADGANNQPLNVTLSWAASNGATDYSYCLDTSINGTCDESWTDAGNTTSVVVSGLHAATTYEWQIRAHNAAGITNANGGAWWSFSRPVTLVPPASLSAIATSISEVALTWSAVSGATGYQVFRSNSVSDEYALDFATNATSGTSSGLLENTTYLYKVRAMDAEGPSGFSPVDPATTVIFANTNLTGQFIQATHFARVCTAVKAMRVAAALSGLSCKPDAGTPILRQQLIDLRAALDGARFTFGLPTISYSDPNIVAGSTAVRAAHVIELRAGTQ